MHYLLLLLAAVSTCALEAAADPSRGLKLVAVDHNEKTITVEAGFKPKFRVEGEEPHNRDTFKATDFTRIHKNGLKSSFSELKPGLRVFVTIGMTRDSAAAIDAYDTPPKGNNKKGNQAFSKITSDIILSVDNSQIKVAQKGGHQVKAYHVTPSTQVTINGEKAEISSLSKGMEVVVNIGVGGNIAAAINAQD